MTVRELRQVLANRAGAKGGGGDHGPLLSLDEVREAGLPATFSDHAERLLYLDDELYDLAEDSAPDHLPKRLPKPILESGVGLEYGWRHADGCACGICRDKRDEALRPSPYAEPDDAPEAVA